MGMLEIRRVYRVLQSLALGATPLVGGCGPTLIAGTAKVNPQYCSEARANAKGSLSIELEKDKLQGAQKIAVRFMLVYKADTNMTDASYKITFPELNKVIVVKTRDDREQIVELTNADLARLSAKSQPVLHAEVEILYPGDWCTGVRFKGIEYK